MLCLIPLRVQLYMGICNSIQIYFANIRNGSSNLDEVLRLDTFLLFEFTYICSRNFSIITITSFQLEFLGAFHPMITRVRSPHSRSQPRRLRQNIPKGIFFYHVFNNQYVFNQSRIHSINAYCRNLPGYLLDVCIGYVCMYVGRVST